MSAHSTKVRSTRKPWLGCCIAWSKTKPSLFCTGRAAAGSPRFYRFSPITSAAPKGFAQADLEGLSENQFLRQLEIQLRLGGTETDSSAIRWRRLLDFFQSASDSGLFAVLLLDNLEDAEPRALTAIKRLVHLHDQSAAHLVVIAGLDHGQHSPRVSDLLERAEMCVEVGPLRRSETESYVESRLKASGNAQAVFEADTIDQLQQLTGGVPREINRLCDLALLAGMSEQQTALGPQLLAALAEEYGAVSRSKLRKQGRRPGSMSGQGAALGNENEQNAKAPTGQS